MKGTFRQWNCCTAESAYSISGSDPFFGALLNNHSLFVYITWLLVFLTWVFLYRTPYGFWMRAAGEHPESLETAGISPQRMKFAASVLCGVFCGFAGHLSLGYLTMFSEGMSSSRGFIAFACVIFGMANPPKVFWRHCCSISGRTGSAAQNVGVPADLTSAIPYLATVLMLVYIAVSVDKKKEKKNS